MLVRTLIAGAALAGLMMTGAVTTTAFAQTSGDQPMKKSMPMPMHKGSAMHKSMAKEGHKMDNIADKLNACEMKPTADRQSCISDATKM